MSSSKGSETSIRGVVTRLCGRGRRQYVVTFPKDPHPESGLTEDTSITFSMQEWKGVSVPEPGQLVDLDDVRLFERGWRASTARPVTGSSNKH